ERRHIERGCEKTCGGTEHDRGVFQLRISGKTLALQANLKSLQQIRIMLPFLPNCGAWPMSRIDDEVIRQPHELRLNALDEQVHIASRKTGTADAALKQNGATENLPVFFGNENDAVQGVAGDVLEFPSDSPGVEMIATIEEFGHLKRRNRQGGASGE